MTTARLNKLWQATQSNVNRMMQIERPPKPKALPPDRELCLEELGYRYVKYCMIYKNLQTCFDTMVHPQKLILIEKLLNSITGRIVEMRLELERLAVSEYVNLVDTCFDAKITLAELELKLGKIQSVNKMVIIRQRQASIDYILASVGMTEGEKGCVVAAIMCTIPEAVRLIQKEQRAFAHRVKAKLRLRAIEAKRRMAGTRSADVEDHNQGIIKFQSLWRGHRVRSHMTELRSRTEEFIGMKFPDNLLTMRKALLNQKDYNRRLANDDDYKTDIILKTEEYMETHGPIIQSDLSREIREWILEYRDAFGNFPQFPTEEEGGSSALFSFKSVAEVEEEVAELAEAQLDALAGKKSAGGGGNKKEKEKGKGGEKNSKDKAGDVVPFEMNPSNFIDSDIIPDQHEYQNYWMNKDESDNPEQHYDPNVLMEGVHNVVEADVRKHVDELMRAELELMEKGIDGIVAGKKKPKKGKPSKSGKSKGKKKVKDMTEGVPLEDLFKELVLAGVVKKVPTVNLKDFVGKVNMMSPKDSEEMEFIHDLGDVRKMIFDYAILPMSSADVHARAPLQRSLMIVGPHGSGKKMLVDAICTELGANQLDLTAENIDGQYEDKEDQKRLIHLVFKVAKLTEPSVIYIGDCDQMFTKNLPPDVTTNPGRLKKDLMKAMKTIAQGDRILLIGTSKFPFVAAPKPMFTLYERLIFIHPPSSESRYALWNRFITDYKGIMPWPQFQLTPLSHVSKGYTAGDIKNATMEVLTEKRVKRLQSQPLTLQEFVTRISTFDPVYIEEQEAFEKWLTKTPLKKKLTMVLELEEAGEYVMDLL